VTNERGGPADRAYRIVGRVQGVGFRWWTRGVATELELVGSVRNLPDGTVEVRARGERATMEELERRLAVGPRFSRVDRVEVLDPVPLGDADDFRIEE
jgi:acylphosphatase